VRVLLAVTACLVTMVGVPPAAADGLCSSTATVAWETDVDELTITAAVVHAPGCSDGEAVGIQLLLDDGSEVPEDGPLMGTVTEERSRFDLGAASVSIEPVTGVRVFLEVHGAEHSAWQITVDRRFFNPAGSEQVGLRDLTILQVPHGGSYPVEGAPPRYRERACAHLGYRPDDRIAEGSGIFQDVAAGGRHIVCFQQVTPGRGQASDAAPRDGSLEREPDDRSGVVGTSRERPGPSSTAGPLVRLAMTGNDLLLAAAIGLVTVGVGLGLLRRSRA
jgi:hypothetical protein